MHNIGCKLLGLVENAMNALCLHLLFSWFGGFSTIITKKRLHSSPKHSKCSIFAICIFLKCSLLDICICYKVFAVRHLYFLKCSQLARKIACARKNKHTALMLADARKDHSIPLEFLALVDRASQQTDTEGLITWRISARLLKQILLKSNCRLHGDFFSPGCNRPFSCPWKCI